MMKTNIRVQEPVERRIDTFSHSTDKTGKKKFSENKDIKCGIGTETTYISVV